MFVYGARQEASDEFQLGRLALKKINGDGLLSHALGSHFTRLEPSLLDACRELPAGNAMQDSWAFPLMMC
jgi:hypothetical protein